MRLIRKTAAPVLLVVLAATAAYSQPPPPGPAGEFMKKHQYTFELMRLVRHIQQIDADPKYTLKPGQAKRALAILKPLRSKPKLTQTEAKKAVTSLRSVFTKDQLAAMAKIKPGQRFGRPPDGDRPPGDNRQARRGSGPPGSIEPPPKDGVRKADQGPPVSKDQGTRFAGPPGGPNAMVDFNPFYRDPKATDEWAKRRAARWDDFLNSLQRKANKASTAAKAGSKAVR